jgi:EAL domain-containing protein (putative c-di-GMP-specific phosphodiesterase class I)/GGDEF domain-containing protein
MNQKLLCKLKYFNQSLPQIFCILLLILIIDYIVYITGGTALAYSHIMYLPIILSAFLFGIKGGVGTAVLSGITLGPFMPVHVSDGLWQEPSSWILRTVLFIIIGLTIGMLFDRIKTDKERQIKKLYEHITTGYQNSNKLRLDVNEMITKHMEFTLVAFRIVNFDHVNRYADYKIGEKSALEVLEGLTKLFGRDNIYSIYTNETIIVMRQCAVEVAYANAKNFLSNFNEPIFINGLPVGLVMKGGIANYPLHGKETNELFEKINRALDHEVFDQNGVTIYENTIEKKIKENYETAILLYYAVKHNELTIVYQPKINLENNEVIGVEALLRWNNGTKGKMNPEEFIRIAEEAGIINDVTRWVLKNVVQQLKEWQDQGIKTKAAINISSKDLRDDSIIEYTINCIKENQIEPTMLEFELTERTIVENENRLEHFLDCLKKIGMKISLDDFGTGNNSLIHLISLPIDFIKIDKIFIDHINDIHNKALIGSIINLVHNLEMKVIAEGVETEEQIKILRNMGCDNIQGYYFSKPLPPDKIKDFILNFNETSCVCAKASKEVLSED